MDILHTDPQLTKPDSVLCYKPLYEGSTDVPGVRGELGLGFNRTFLACRSKYPSSQIIRRNTLLMFSPSRY